jgi:hypothetical protein
VSERQSSMTFMIHILCDAMRTVHIGLKLSSRNSSLVERDIERSATSF